MYFTYRSRTLLYFSAGRWLFFSHNKKTLLSAVQITDPLRPTSLLNVRLVVLLKEWLELSVAREACRPSDGSLFRQIPFAAFNNNLVCWVHSATMKSTSVEGNRNGWTTTQCLLWCWFLFKWLHIPQYLLEILVIREKWVEPCRQHHFFCSIAITSSLDHFKIRLICTIYFIYINWIFRCPYLQHCLLW